MGTGLGWMLVTLAIPGPSASTTWGPGRDRPCSAGGMGAGGLQPGRGSPWEMCASHREACVAVGVPQPRAHLTCVTTPRLQGTLCLTCDQGPEAGALSTSPPSWQGRPGQPVPNTYSLCPGLLFSGSAPQICTTRAGQEGGRRGRPALSTCLFPLASLQTFKKSILLGVQFTCNKLHPLNVCNSICSDNTPLHRTPSRHTTSPSGEPPAGGAPAGPQARAQPPPARTVFW